MARALYRSDDGEIMRHARRSAADLEAGRWDPEGGRMRKGWPPSTPIQARPDEGKSRGRTWASI